jgi:hypothetical protein
MDKIELNYSLTKDIFEKNILKINADRLTSKYPQSHKALFYCQKKIDCLLRGIDELSNKNEYYYFIQATTRIIVEHFIVGHFIWTRTHIEKSDNCGIEYYAHYRLSELLKRENYELVIEGIEKKIKNNATFENMQRRFADAPHPITQSDIEDTHRIGNQFEIKSIFNYLLNRVPENDFFAESHKSLAQFLRMYNKLSSFVHGGPSAEFETYDDESIIDTKKTIEDSISYAKIASRLLKEHIMMLFLEEKPEYQQLLEPIMNLKKVQK